MKCMNCMWFQAILLVGLALVGGGAANLARSGDPEKFLPWATDLYAAPEPANRIPAPPSTTTPGSAHQKPAADAVPVEPVPDAADSDTGDQTPAPEVTPPAVASTKEDGAEEGEFPKIGFEEALEEYQAGATFVDARRTREYVEGHITGAICISPYEQSVLAEKIARVAQEIPEEAPVVVYCTASADCEDSALISRQLQAAGLQNISIYKGGFPEWDAKLRNDERRAKLITTGAEPGEREL